MSLYLHDWLSIFLMGLTWIKGAAVMYCIKYGIYNRKKSSVYHIEGMIALELFISEQIQIEKMSKTPHIYHFCLNIFKAWCDLVLVSCCNHADKDIKLNIKLAEADALTSKCMNGQNIMASVIFHTKYLDVVVITVSLLWQLHNNISTFFLAVLTK